MGAIRHGGRHVDRLTVAGSVARADGNHAPVGAEQLDREAGGQRRIERECPDRDRLAGRRGEGVMIDARVNSSVDPTDDGEAIAGSVDHDRRSIDRLGRFRGVVADQIRRRVGDFLFDRGIDDHAEVVAPASLHPDHTDRVLAGGRYAHRLKDRPDAGRR